MLLRRLERWLHQHIFKVGWLLTKNFHTTTILFYAFFLPGVFLHELSYWLAAGILNVRAERAIQWPEKQEIAQLRLTFIRLRNPSPLRLAIITAAPLVTGLVAIWFIANSVLNVSDFLGTMRSGRLSDVAAALGLLTAVPDFWLWIYLLFTISNTMVPNLKDLRGGRVLLVILVVIVVGFALIGVGSQVVLRLLNGPIADALYLLSSIFAIVIAVNVFATAVLGAVESLIERITGDSATFENGKLVAITRAERIEMQRRQARAIQTRRGAETTMTAGTPSVYRLQLPIPGPPGKEPVTPNILIEKEEPPSSLKQSPLPLAAPVRDDRAGPDMITAPVSAKLPSPAPTHEPASQERGKGDEGGESPTKLPDQSEPASPDQSEPAPASPQEPGT